MVLQRLDDKSIYHVVAAYLKEKGWETVDCGYYLQWQKPCLGVDKTALDTNKFLPKHGPQVLMDALYQELRDQIGDNGGIFS